MTPQQVLLVQQSFDRLTAIGQPAWEGFYNELFAIEPSLRRMFKNDDLHSQSRKLLSALALAIGALNGPASSLDPLKALAIRHVGYGVKPEDYNYVGNALLRTLEKGLGAEFTPELRHAWVAAFQALANIMIEAAHGQAAPAHPNPEPATSTAASQPAAEMWVLPI